MRYQSFLRVVFSGLVLLFIGHLSAQGTRPKTVLEIVSNRSIWGKDFPLALAQMEALSNSNDKTAELLPKTLTLSRRFINAAAAEASVKGVNAALRGVERQDLYKKTKKNFPFESRMAKPGIIKSLESDSVVVALSFGEVEILKPGIRITDIEKEIGVAQSVSYRVKNSQGDELPLIITYHLYANGAIVFVESNSSSEPRLLDKVYFDTPKLVSALKTSLK